MAFRIFKKSECGGEMIKKESSKAKAIDAAKEFAREHCEADWEVIDSENKIIWTTDE